MDSPHPIIEESRLDVVKGFFVTKRDGSRVPFQRSELLSRCEGLVSGFDTSYVRLDDLVDKVASGLVDGASTMDIDRELAESAAYFACSHPDYSLLAGRLAVTSLHKSTVEDFGRVAELLYEYRDSRTNRHTPLLDEPLYLFIQEHRNEINSVLDYSRDLEFDYFGYKTLERSYLLKVNGNIVERPQHLFMRVALGIHIPDLDAAFETYDMLSTKYFTHASPTLFNAGTPKPQLSSCFLLTMKDDSIDGIYDTLKSCALISKCAGGIGLSVSTIRASGSYIAGTNGTSNGLVPMIRVFNDTARYVDQGGGKRKGAFAIYLEPWHSDIISFLDLKKNHGKEELRARDLFYALWIPDLFMQRVEHGGEWSLFCPNEAPGLCDVWGEEFEELYHKYEREGRAKKRVKAQDLWFAILESQIETGTPYILYKDTANRKSNQQNLGTIRSSNLCTEIIEYSSPDEFAVCNLASIALPKFVTSDRTFDHQKLYEITKVVTRNLNKIIDINYYPVPETRRSNMRHRPIGIGVQGLADVFIKMRFPFESDAARKLNRDIFETIYYASLEASCELAASSSPYETYEGSPVSRGILQFDMWNVRPSNRWNWDQLRSDIARHGVRNSLLVAPMPTASTSQILGNNECIEPYTSNLYNRRVLAGEFPVVNQHLVRDLIERDMWTPDIINQIIANNGSIQEIEFIPEDIKELYKTVWEMKQRSLVEMAADRGAFIDQSQSFNVFFAEPSVSKLTGMHFYGWKKGLKTGMYYLRTKPAASAVKFSLDASSVFERVMSPNKVHSPKSDTASTSSNEDILEISGSDEEFVCRMEEGCMMCGS